MKRVIALYFSPTLTSRKTAAAIGKRLSEILALEYREIDITTPKQRKPGLEFCSEDIVVFGAPVYIGRMPNLISPYFKTIKGNGAIGIPVAVYGCRDYDDGLIELRDIMQEDGFRCIAAGAFLGEHSFSTTLGGGRPDSLDYEKAREFASIIAGRITSGNFKYPVEVKGTPFPYRGVFNAKDNGGKSIDIRKVAPKTDLSKCTGCGFCAKICPMGSISPDDCTDITGICIKCCACVKRCPTGAKYFDDSTYLEHKKILEDKFGSVRKEPEIF